MAIKKFFGYLFIVLSIILTVAVIGQIPRILKDIFGFIRVFSGSLNTYESAKAITKFVFWIIYFGILSLIWNYGKKWTKQLEGNY